jgi:phosphatidylglycerol:prolipoprotein diacylglycerol transferase
MTCPAALAKVGRAPGIIPGIWGALVGLGVLLATGLTAIIGAREGLSVGRLLLVALIAILVGAVGAKTWYVVQSPRHQFDGWCIQGFIVGVMLGAVPSLAVAGLPIGVSLDAASPGLLLAMSLGRVGCFFAGCCGGPPTASRWAVWSSDQRVGARRIPTQLLEVAITFVIGTALLVVLLMYRPAPSGALLVAGLAAYTLVRQGLLRLRAQPRRWPLVGAAIATAAGAVLVASVATLIVAAD